MAPKKLLNCLKKRDLLNSDHADKSLLISLGEQFGQEGRLSDSIDFFEKAEHIEGLNKLREQCGAEGDFFLYLRLMKILAESPGSEEWVRLGDTALGRGKLLFARSAYREADHREKLAHVEELLSLSPQDRTPDKLVLH
ncbi:MAG: hypothetical protein JSU72_04445 [Deltaproteobacteria bacterium]|nr:MAG: hypothetical protein JSU72_04445 [Deltaproteobacteria bacterium]